MSAYPNYWAPQPIPNQYQNFNPPMQQNPGEPELYGDHDADEAPPDEMVCVRCKQSGKGAVPPRKQRTGENDRTIYGRTGLDDADEAGNRDPKCSQGAKEGWKRKQLCGSCKPTHASVGGNADGIQKSVQTGIYRIEAKQYHTWMRQ